MAENEQDNSLDVLGVKPIGKALEHASKETVNGGKNFLSKICMPAAEEFGLLLKDHVSNWRATNAQKTLEKAEKKLLIQGNYEDKKAHPLIAWRIIESSSWAQHDELQEIWAGLLASTCTECGTDDSNLMFISLIAQLSEVQIKIINYAVENSSKEVYEHDLITSKELKVSMRVLLEVLNIEDTNRLDRELDHMSSLDLIGDGLTGGGIILEENASDYSVDITPRPLSIQLYVRCQGFLGTPKEYFNLEQHTQG